MGRIASVILAAAMLLARPVAAAEWVDNDSGRVGLVAATTATGQAATVEAGLAFRLKPGWHIYWRTPGDAGFPPRVDWSGSENIGAPQVSWPAPSRFVLAGLQNYGYFGEVVLPISVPLASPGKPVKLAALVDYLACDKLCVPLQARLELSLPAGPAEPAAAFHAIGRFKALVPGDGAGSGLSLATAQAVGNDALRLTVTANNDPMAHPDAFVEAPDTASFDQPKLILSEGGRRAVLTLAVVPGTRQTELAGAPLRVTVVDGDRSLETVVAPVAVAAAPEPPPLSLLAMIGVALLGGLILNLMPCVLPVLSIKVLGAIGHGGAERGHVRAAFLCSAIGILASFLALAGAAIVVKRAGLAVGWGIQFQQPVFLAAMVAVLTLFAANLWGAFEIALPSWLMNSGGKIKHHTLLGHFLSGAFATLLATPCSAPFVGTAIGFALARGPLEIVAIFAALGIGMGAPFLLVAVRPEAAIRLPKPGRWMLTVKKALGLVLAATAAWLLSVLGAQAGWLPAALVGGAMVAIAAMLTLRHRLPENSRSAAAVAAAALAAAAVVVPLQSGFGERAAALTEAPASGIAWIPFSPTVLAAAVESGHTVFVDVTADWCITCKVNKAAVVDRGEVAKRLTTGGVVAMRADWTRPDDGITRYLASFGRYGVPFNAVYGPKAKDGLPLSELLSEADILAALDRAGGE